MKLHLKNFCCWENETFEFPDDGNVLLSAPSGFGKTSIIRALLFVLFDSNPRGIIRIGTKRCSVQLEYKNLHIMRQRGPKRLVVNHMYEGDEAQSFINEVFGKDIMYLEQKGRNTFVNMSPSAKLEYLESIAFSSIDINAIKKKVKESHKRCETIHIESKACYEMSRHLYNQLDEEPVVHLPSHLEDKTMSMVDESYNYVRGKMIQCEQQVATLKNQELERNELMDEYVLLNQFYETMDLGQFKSDELQLYTDKLRQCTKYNTFLDAQKSYNDLKKQYDRNLEIQQKNLEDTITTLETELESIHFSENEYKSIKKVLSLFEQKHNIENQLNVDKSQELEDAQSTYTHYKELLKSYKCPECKSVLQLIDGHLTLCADTPSTLEHDELRRECSTLSRVIDTLTKHETKRVGQCSLLNKLETEIGDVSFEDVSDEFDVMKTMYEQKRILESRLLDTRRSLSKLTEQYEEQRLEMSEAKQRCDELKCTYDDLDEQSIREKLYDLKRIHTKYKEWEHKKNVLDNKWEVYNNNNNVDLFDTIVDLELQCSNYRTQLDNYNHDKTILQQYNDYVHYKNALDNMNTANEEYTKAEKRLVAINKLREKIKEATSISITNLIQTINTNVQVYLDAFFPNETLYAELVPCKDSSKKVQLNIQINYRDMDVNITTLSGGEYDRVILAYALTFAEISNAPIIILDECVGSLDQENANNVFQFINKYHQGKLVLLVAHQIITGIFEHVEDLTKRVEDNRLEFEDEIRKLNLK